MPCVARRGRGGISANFDLDNNARHREGGRTQKETSRSATSPQDKTRQDKPRNQNKTKQG